MKDRRGLMHGTPASRYLAFFKIYCMLTSGMDGSLVWYFAYGSNMSVSVIMRRGITPLDAKNVVVKTHILVFDVFGVPFSEPAMAGIQHRPTNHSGPSVHGVAYLLSAADYHRLKVSEGAGTGYVETLLEAEVILRADASQGATSARDAPGAATGALHSLTTDSAAARSPPRLKVATLVAKWPFHPTRLPSVRYMSLLIDGATQCDLARDYLLYLQSLPTYTVPTLSWFHELCAVRMFLGFWHPVLSFVMRRIKARAEDSPEWTAATVNVLFRAMWFYHDAVHRRIWRCDGGM